MDFKRIEWIFFLAFLGVNLFLFSIFQSAKNEERNVATSNQKIAIEQRLKADSISYDGDFATDKPTGYYLSGIPTNMQKAISDYRRDNDESDAFSLGTTTEEYQVTRRISDGTSITDANKTAATLAKFLQQDGEVLFGEEYTYLENLSFQDQEYPEIVAAQSFEKIPFNDSSSRLDIQLENTDDLLKITRYTQTHISQIEKLRDQTALYSERDAIETLYVNNRIPPKSKIAWRQLAYTLSLQFRGTNVYIPVWFVAIDTGSSLQVEKVNAITNRVFTNTPVQKVEKN